MKVKRNRGPVSRVEVLRLVRRLGFKRREARCVRHGGQCAIFVRVADREFVPERKGRRGKARGFWRETVRLWHQVAGASTWAGALRQARAGNWRPS